MWLLLHKSSERVSKTPSQKGVTVWPLHNTWTLNLIMYPMYQTDAYCRSLSNRQIQNQIWILSRNSSMGLTRKKIPKLRRRLPIQAHQEMRTSLATRVTWCRTLTMTRIMLRTSSLSTCHQRRYAYARMLHPPYMLSNDINTSTDWIAGLNYLFSHLLMANWHTPFKLLDMSWLGSTVMRFLWSGQADFHSSVAAYQRL